MPNSISAVKLILWLITCLSLAAPLAATNLRQELTSAHRKKADISSLVKLLGKLFPELRFIENPVEPIFYAVGSSEDVIRLKAVWKMLDVEVTEWILVAPNADGSLELIHDAFPTASTTEGRVEFKGSRYEAKLLQHLCETGSLESVSSDE